MDSSSKTDGLACATAAFQGKQCCVSVGSLTESGCGRRHSTPPAATRFGVGTGASGRLAAVPRRPGRPVAFGTCLGTVDGRALAAGVAALCWRSASAGDRGALMDGVASIRGDCSGRDRAGGTATEETATGRGAAQSTPAPPRPPFPQSPAPPVSPTRAWDVRARARPPGACPFGRVPRRRKRDISPFIVIPGCILRAQATNLKVHIGHTCPLISCLRVNPHARSHESLRHAGGRECVDRPPCSPQTADPPGQAGPLPPSLCLFPNH